MKKKKVYIDYERKSVYVGWGKRAVILGRCEQPIENTEVILEFRRPAEGIKANDTIGHQFKNGQSITAAGLTADALIALRAALGLYCEHFGPITPPNLSSEPVAKAVAGDEGRSLLETGGGV